MMHSVKANAKRGGKKGKAKHISVEKADNGGFVSRTSFEEAPMKRGQMSSYVEPEVGAHKDLAAVHSHIDKHFGGAAPVEDTDNDGA